MNKRLLQALALAICPLLVMSAFVMIPKAQAQTTVALHLDQRVNVVYNDGSTESLSQYVQFVKTAQLTSGGKVITAFDFRTVVVTEPSTSMLITSVAGVSFDIKVRNALGNYVAVSQSGSDTTPQKLFGITDTQWQLFYLRVPAATIDALIGSRTTDITSEIRFTALGPTTGVKVTAKINNVSGEYIAPLAVLQVPLVAKSTGGIDPGPGPCTSGCPATGPTGKLYYRISFNDEYGGVHTYTSVDIQKLPALADLVSITGDGTPFTQIKWDLLLQLDNFQNYNVPTGIAYDNAGEAGNYLVTVNGQTVNSVNEAGIKHIGFGLYQLNSMIVTRADIRDKLEVLSPGPDPDTNVVTGTVSFLTKHATLKLTSTGGTFNVDIPRQEVAVKVGGIITIVDGGGDGGGGGGNCDILNGVTTCQQPLDLFDQIGKFFGDMFNVDATTGLFLFAVMVAIITGMVLIVASLVKRSPQRQQQWR